MFQIIENVPFDEVDGNKIYHGMQLKFLGIAFAPKYYKFSEENSQDGLIIYRDYLWGDKTLVCAQKSYRKPEKKPLIPVGEWLYFSPEDQKKKAPLMRLSETKEYDDNGRLKEVIHYYASSYQISYYDGRSPLTNILTKTEHYDADNQLTYRETYEGKKTTKEDFYFLGKNRVHHILSKDGNKFLSESKTITDKNGKIIERTSYELLSNGYFIKIHEEENKKTKYSLLSYRSTNSQRYYVDGGALLTAASKEMLFAIMIQRNRLKKANSKKRQKLIALIRKEPTLKAKKVVLLAFKSLEKN